MPGAFVHLPQARPADDDHQRQSPELDVAVRDAKVKTSAWRVVASKTLLTFGVAAGVGQDKYDDEANVQGTVKTPIPASQSVALSQSLTRTNYFVDLSLNLPVFKLVGEVGQVIGRHGRYVQRVRDGTRPTSRAPTARWVSAWPSSMASERLAAPDDGAFMRRALALAERGWGQHGAEPDGRRRRRAGRRRRRRRMARASTADRTPRWRRCAPRASAPAARPCT